MALFSSLLSHNLGYNSFKPCLRTKRGNNDDAVAILNNDKKILHFSRLTKLGAKQAIAITLQEVAEVMFTSTRHCRTLLNELRDLGWLEWTPKAGRNQRSRLYLVYTLDELKAELAQQMIAVGKYEKALAFIDHDQQLFGQLLQNTSGAVQREGRLHIQLTYGRSFAALLPHIALRNSERFLLRQVYCCLVQCDKDGIITPQLAHHWVYNAELQRWRFYLRPALTFHDGSAINAEKIAELFNRLKQLATYQTELAHVSHITAINPLCIDFQLDQPDPGFAGLLADVKYSIQPCFQLQLQPHPNSNPNSNPNSQFNTANAIVGSGAFRVQEHTQQYLRLQAYDNYYSHRALTDTVTIWQVSSPQTDLPCTTEIQANVVQKTSQIRSNYATNSLEQENRSLKQENSSLERDIDSLERKTRSDEQVIESAQKSRIEYGCLLAMVNSKAELSLLQRKYLSQLLAADKLMAELKLSANPIEAIPAYNLLSSWLKVISIGTTQQPLASKLTIAIFEHHTLKECAQAMVALLKQVGINCQVNVYAFEEFVQKASTNSLSEDLILISLDLDDNLPTSVFHWMLSNSILNQSLSAEASTWLQTKLINIRQQQPLTNYLTELESISTAMITEHWMIPMLHHRQTLYFQGVLKGVSINVWGWPDIQDVWSEELINI
ncbi:SgrR family transcriptional regulator [Moritella sp. Urea-trap-13]|uniref:SgrR family transcriptional regulator n=1 Tax=Moritella sp. Urea-trap-13 TaxID=2058327 RepID=UPI000C338771|nr:SgrR family transcriptional regulator [Moritella sp. Urea-trap-13]PKH07852.1 peptide-binding protein [Moritella sp. Urea-trap-13]